MSSISIHNLDSEISSKIKQIARKKNQSINKTVKELLETTLNASHENKSNRRMFEKFCGKWDDEEYNNFKKATEEFENVDPDDWK